MELDIHGGKKLRSATIEVYTKSNLKVDLLVMYMITILGSIIYIHILQSILYTLI